MSLFIGTQQESFEENMQFPNLNCQIERFQFGLEVEFLLVSLPEYQPLWYRDLTFGSLNEILESISLDDLPGRMDLLEVEPPHRKKMPYVVEGYHIPNEEYQMVDIRPKGIEIRTPICSSINECLGCLELLFDRLQKALQKRNLKAVCLSHHPVESEFYGKPNKRRYDYWKWAMEVMTTYGPDINVSVPTSLLQDFDQKDFERKVNFYAPAFTALSVGSPFLKNKLWEIAGRSEFREYGKSYRTFRRSIIAPPIEFHQEEENRFEFKVFEMSPYLGEYHGFFLLFLALLLNPRLPGRTEKPNRIYELGEVAQRGMEASGIREKLENFLSDADEVLMKYDFDPQPLQQFRRRMQKKETYADELIQVYLQNHSMSEVLQYASYLREEKK